MKQKTIISQYAHSPQPPSGGCVLKPKLLDFQVKGATPAAFRRLCVETRNTLVGGEQEGPAAFRRLCVETIESLYSSWINSPAAFRRLCVETRISGMRHPKTDPAAFRRLCVETRTDDFSADSIFNQPPSGGCVLKPPRQGKTTH